MSTALVINEAVLRHLKPESFAALALAKNGAPGDIANVVPISAGSGAPNHNAHVTGELYIRTDGTAAAGTILYAATNTSGTWAPLISLANLALSVIALTDNTATALDIKEASNSYLKFSTTNGSESVTVGKPLLLNGGIAPGGVFESTEQTANGSPQNIAHGLGTAPSFVTAYVTDSGATGIYTLVPGARDATNIVFNGTAGIKYRVQALK
jgi:hypothetical protein